MHAPASAGRAPRLVKRYRNRKFYDTLECRYVRLEELAEVIARGCDVRVVEHDGDRDITQATLFALLGLRERQAPSLEPAALHDLVRGVLAAPDDGAAPGELLAAPAGDPSSAQRLAELRARGERLRVEAEASWAASRARAEAVRAAIQAQAGAAWGAVGALGKVNRELRRLRAEIDDLVAQLDPPTPRASAGG